MKKIFVSGIWMWETRMVWCYGRTKVQEEVYHLCNICPSILTMPHIFFAKRKTLQQFRLNFCKWRYVSIYITCKNRFYDLYLLTLVLFKKNLSCQPTYTEHSKLTLAKKCNETHRYQLMRVNLCITALSA